MNSTSYGLTHREWKPIKEAVISDNIKSEAVSKKYNLNSEQIWFLYDILLQEKYNHLYKREKLVNPKVGDYVYCDSEGFGRGKIMTIKPNDNMMFIKFDNRELQSLCSTIDMVTIHDEVKRKVTRL